MTWPSFAAAYAIVALVCLLLCRRKIKGRWWPLVRTLAIVTIMLCIFDGVAESRLLWRFSETLGLYVLDVPLENILITLATTMTSMFLFLLFDRPSS
jgi:lycopene cyclase domain-containing protein